MIRLIVNGREARCETSEPLTSGSVDEAGLLSFANAGGEALFNVQLPLYEGEVSGWTS